MQANINYPLEISSEVSFVKFLARNPDEQARMETLRAAHDAVHINSAAYADHVWQATTAPTPAQQVAVIFDPTLNRAQPARYTANPQQGIHIIDLNPLSTDAEMKISCIFEVLNAATSQHLALEREQIPNGRFVELATSHSPTHTDWQLASGQEIEMPAVMFARACEELEYKNIATMRTIRDQLTQKNIQLAQGVSNQQVFQLYDRWPTFDAYYNEQVLAGHSQHYINAYARSVASAQQHLQQPPQQHGQNYWSDISVGNSSSRAVSPPRQGRTQ